MCPFLPHHQDHPHPHSGRYPHTAHEIKVLLQMLATNKRLKAEKKGTPEKN